MEELSRDNSFIKILSNLNEYTFDEMKMLYSISKTALIFAISGEPVNLKTYIFLNINKIVDSILENIEPSNLKLESVVYIVCRILRLLFKNKVFEILNSSHSCRKYLISSCSRSYINTAIQRNSLFLQRYSSLYSYDISLYKVFGNKAESGS